MSTGDLPGTSWRDRYLEPDYLYRMYLVMSEYFEEYAPIEPFIRLVTNFGRAVDTAEVITHLTQPNGRAATPAGRQTRPATPAGTVWT